MLEKKIKAKEREKFCFFLYLTQPNLNLEQVPESFKYR